MDHHDSPFSVKPNDSKPKTIPKVNQPAKMGTVRPQICRQKRAFGTARSTNLPTKPVTDKSIIKFKPKVVVPLKKPAIQPSVDTTTKIVIEASDKEFPENVNPRFTKKSEGADKTSKNSQEIEDSAEPQTPVASHFRSKSKVSATPVTPPFYSAVHCSKCRFDRLETSSYWVGQIKLAESVGKHFVAVDFFRLALESQAEPIRNMRVELKRYLSRHGYLSEQKEWREVGIRYGLLKVESNSNTCDVESSI